MLITIIISFFKKELKIYRNVTPNNLRERRKMKDEIEVKIGEVLSISISGRDVGLVLLPQILSKNAVEIGSNSCALVVSVTRGAV